MRIRGGIIFISLLVTFSAQAQVILAGPEWEVTNAVLFRGDAGLSPQESSVMTISNANLAGRDRLTNYIDAHCGKCFVEELENKFGVNVYKITFPEMKEWWAIINVDPGTVEIQAKPLTLKEYKAFTKKIQHYIFDAAQAMQLKVRWDLRSAGHMHFGLKDTFGDNRLLFRNFVVDFMNHPELASGILEYDTGNAPPLFTAAQVRALKKILVEFDKGRMTIATFSRRIVTEVQIDNPQDWQPSEKYQALNFLRIIDDKIPASEKTIEIRSLRAQRNMDEFVLVLDFFQTWMNHLATLTEPIPLDVPLATFDPASAESRFRYLIKDMGGNWSKFKKIMPKYMIEPSISDDFIYSESAAFEKIKKQRADNDPIQNISIPQNPNEIGVCFNIFARP